MSFFSLIGDFLFTFGIARDPTFEFILSLHYALISVRSGLVAGQAQKMAAMPDASIALPGSSLTPPVFVMCFIPDHRLGPA